MTSLLTRLKVWWQRRAEETCENGYHLWLRQDYLPGWISYTCRDCGKESWG